MEALKSKWGPAPIAHLLPKRIDLAAWLPHGPLALTLGIVGIVNILHGLRLPSERLRSIAALNSLEGSLSALGGTAEVILGIVLLAAAVGLFRR